MPQVFFSKKIYKDNLVKILGSLLFTWFIVSIGRSESILKLLLEPTFYIDLFTGFIIALVTWEMIARITYYLDKRLDWVEKTSQRIFSQLFMAIAFPALLVFMLTFLLFKLLWNQDIFTNWTHTEYPMVIVLILLINTYYLMYYFIFKWKMAETQLLSQNNVDPNPNRHAPEVEQVVRENKSQAIIVSKGAKNIALGAEDIAYCYINNENNYIKTDKAETFITPLSLDDIAEILDSYLFFRANRQIIINRTLFASFSNIENGKLQVFLKPPFDEQIVVSQKKAKEFKDWLVAVK